MRISSINSSNIQHFGAFKVAPKCLDEIHKNILRDHEDMIDEFDKIVDILKDSQKDNLFCDIELFKGVSPLTGDISPTMGLFDKYGTQMMQLNVRQPQYKQMPELEAFLQMFSDINKIANDYPNVLEKVFVA